MATALTIVLGGFVSPSRAAIDAPARPTTETVVGDLIKTLGDADESVRWAAADALASIGEKSVPSLIDALEQDPAPKARLVAAATLGNMRAKGAKVVPALRKALAGDADPDVKRAAAAALSQLGQAFPKVIEELRWILRVEDRRMLRVGRYAPDRSAFRIRFARAGAIPDIKFPLEFGVLSATLEDPGADPKHRESAAASFGKMGAAAAPAIEQLVWWSKHDLDEGVRRAADDAVKAILEQCWVVVGEYVAGLKNRDASVRRASARGLGNIRALEGISAEATEPTASFIPLNPADALPPVLRDLKDGDHLAAATILGDLGSEAGAAVPDLLQIVQKAHDEGRRFLKGASPGAAAASALGRIHSDPGKCVPGLIEALTSRDPLLREAAAEALGRFGQDARLAIPALKQRMSPAETDASVQWASTLALWAIDPTDRVAADSLTAALADDSDPGRHPLALAALGAGDPSVAARTLAGSLQRLNPQTRRDAVETLGKFGLKAREAAPELVEALKDSFRDVRAAAAEALGKVGADVKQAVPPLMEALRDPIAGVRSAAARALGRFGPGARESVGALVELLKEQDVDVRSAAVETLGNIGADAAAALPELSDLLLRKESAERIRDLLPPGPGHARLFRPREHPRLWRLIEKADRWQVAQAIQKIGAGVKDTGFIPQLNEALTALDLFQLDLDATEQEELLRSVIVPVRQTRDALVKLTMPAEQAPSPLAWNVLTVGGAVALVFGLLVVSARLMRARGAAKAAEAELAARKEEEMREARRRMDGLYPVEGPLNWPGIEAAHRRREAATFSGDFYRFLSMDGGGLGISLIDVVGHGLAAAFQARSLYETMEDHDWGRRGTAREQVARADELVARARLLQQEKAAFCMNFLKIDLKKRVIQHANAGMPDPLLFRRRRALGPLQWAVGLYVGDGYVHYARQPEEVETPFEDGDVLVILSDGILEAQDQQGQLFGPEGVKAALSAAGDGSASAIADAILQAATRHGGNGPPADDQTLIVVRFDRARAAFWEEDGEWRMLEAAQPDACHKALGAWLDRRLAECGVGDELRRRQIWGAVWEAVRNAAGYGSRPGDVIRVGLTPQAKTGGVQVQVIQARPWENWQEHLGPKRKAEVDAGAFLLGGTVMLFWLADRVEVADQGRRVVLQFSPAVKPDRTVQPPRPGPDAPGPSQR
jgi:HEAT repeat protein/serine phosphatase RsbU (regulator of sigma subunit)